MSTVSQKSNARTGEAGSVQPGPSHLQGQVRKQVCVSSVFGSRCHVVGGQATLSHKCQAGAGKDVPLSCYLLLKGDARVQ